MLRRIVTILIAVSTVAALAWALWPRPIAVEATKIARRDITVTIAEEGKARIREVYTVSSPIAGQTLRIDRHAGDAIGKGEAIVSIRPVAPGLLDVRLRRAAEATAASARAGVDLAAAEVKQAEAQLAYLRTELSRAERLASRGTISESARDKARLAVDTGSANLDSAKASLSVRERELERAEAALIEAAVSDETCCTDIKSPVSGRILRVLAESEQVVQAGTPLLTIGNPADIEITADFLSRDVAEIRPGAEALIENWGGAPLTAKVRRIEPSAITKTSALGIEEQRVPVILDLAEPQPPPGLGDGFRVIVNITVWRGENLVAVPVAALFRQGDAWSVYRDDNGTAKRQDVVLGRRNDEYAEVRSGLSEGDVVVLHPSDAIESGSSIAPNTPDQ
ncbi:MAG: efflux RND transporter periplasmic adaptor subunit [Rhizobiales bacterium]|nr:efflux RND transporter periplasmic adaptor subunit [Hyphomicrobiales bacterium]